jgi:FAD dependent oxidoreductase
VATSGKEDEMFSPFLRKPFKKALEAGLIPDSVKTMAGTWGTVSDQGDLTYLNMVHLTLDGTDPDALTHGEMAGRKQAMHAVGALKAFMPGCEDAKLRNFGMTLGIRDTRKIDAVYNMTGDDVREQARFDDSIGIFPEFIDGYGLLILPTTGRYFHVPYRSMLPKGVKNLIVTGRTIGGDKVSHAAVRNMMCCAVAGQGAGVAAAIAVKSDSDFADVDLSKVQSELRRQGARIH